jgi:broad specificity phosphatase PhoE
MKLYLFRHASVASNYQGCYNGHIDIPATNEGLREAKSNFQKLQPISFDALFCSPLQRARKTLESFNLEQEVSFSDLLREKSWGRHEGKSYEEIVEMEGVPYKSFSQWLDLLDGQSFEMFQKDVEKFLSSLADKEFENALIMTHAGVIYTIVYLLKQCSLEEAFGLKIPYGNFYEIDL